MTTSLVSGCAGFIASHVCEHLLAMGHKVIGLDDLSGGSMANVPEGVLFSIGSILDQPLVESLFKDYHPDYVFHLAAYAAEALSHHIRRYNYEVNVVGSMNLINAAINYDVKRFVFASSAAVYGGLEPPFSEDMTPQPVDPYGIAKYAIELDLRAANHMFGLAYTIFRMHNVYGERQNLNDLHRNVVAIFMRQCLQGQPMTIFGGGSQERAFSYIDDVAPYIAKSTTMTATYNETFNIGSTVACRIVDLAELVADAMQVEPRIEYLPPRLEVARVYTTHYKFHEAFGIQYSGVLIEKGLKCMAEWAKTQTLREPQAFTAIEVTKNLPEHWHV